MTTTTVPARAGYRQAHTELTAMCLQVFTDGLPHHDHATFTHEAQRVEAMPPSPLSNQMRAAVQVEQQRRRREARVADLVETFRHAAGNNGLQSYAALSEIDNIRDDVSDQEFREHTLDILRALHQVEGELDGGLGHSRDTGPVPVVPITDDMTVVTFAVRGGAR